MKKIFIFATFAFLFCSASFSQQSGNELTVSSGFFGWQFRRGGEKLNITEAKDLLSANPQATASFKRAQTNSTLAGIIGGVGGFLVGWQLGTSAGGGKANWTAAGIGGGLIVASIPLSVSANKQVKAAVATYNEGLRSTTYRKPVLSAGFTATGPGFRLQF